MPHTKIISIFIHQTKVHTWTPALSLPFLHFIWNVNSRCLYINRERPSCKCYARNETWNTLWLMMIGNMLKFVHVCIFCLFLSRKLPLSLIGQVYSAVKKIIVCIRRRWRRSLSCEEEKWLIGLMMEQHSAHIAYV